MRLVSGSIKILTARVYSAFASYLVLLAVARGIGVEALGRYALVTSVLFGVELVTAQSFSQALIRTASRGSTLAIGSLEKRQWLVVGAATVALWAGAQPLATGFGDQELLAPLIIGAADIAPFSYFMARIGVLHARHGYTSMLLGTVVYSTAKCVFMGLAALLFVRVDLVLGGMVLASMSSATFVWVVSRGAAGNSEEVPQEPLRPLFIAALLLTAGRGVLLTADLWLVQLLQFDEKTTGEYAAAHNLAKLLFIASMSTVAPMLPSLAKEGSLKKAIAVEPGVRHILWLLLAGLLFGTALLSLAAGPIVSLLFGDDFVSSGPYLTRLSPCFGILVAGLVSIQMRFHAGHARRVVAASLLSIAAFFALGLWLGASVGVAGVMYSLAAAGMVQIAICWLPGGDN